MRLNVTNIRSQRLNIGTHREQNTDASLYCSHGREMLQDEGQRRWTPCRRLRTYQADILSKIGSGGKFMQNV